MSPVAIVTASDSGIGQESAKELAENGFDVGITYRTDEAGAQETLRAVENTGRKGEVRRLDLTELPEAADVIDELADSLGGVDCLRARSRVCGESFVEGPTPTYVNGARAHWRKPLAGDFSGSPWGER
jgi:NAD(P)-dependent dehydrogenase (short-subunit alcohol dehydrogenase family)